MLSREFRLWLLKAFNSLEVVLTHLSWRLKWAFLIKICPLSVVVINGRTTRSISIKLGTKHPWVKGNQVCSNKGPCPFPRGNNYDIAKIHLQIFKNLFLNNHWTNFIKLGTNHPWVKGIQISSNEVPRPFPRGIITK